ncbi:SMP-30/gluconolactonase/LRE family protein [Nocardioides speluncae]|uniref:SMP-30/gluconolactonase/LRE family protein n=1 Tax=Nocardioides speluncae TaxID=2670337 RepID=UPI000D6967B0|nr:SMP-30/gluconolactonase/LRE family protein [Nocardioides speluncae]
MDTIYEGIRFGESVRWHDGKPWFADWAAGQVISVAGPGDSTIEASVESFPLCFDFLPDGRLLLASSASRQVLRREADGSLTEYADLAPVSTMPWNEIVVDPRGNAYVNSIGFEFPEGEYAPGFVVLVTPDGKVTQVADDLAFPNGMAVTPDGGTLIVAESYAEQLTAYTIGADGSLGDRRVWAATPGDHPDGICLDDDGAVWYADVGNKHCRRVAEGGEVLSTVDFARSAFSCAIGDGNLYVVGQDFGGNPFAGEPTGLLAVAPLPPK